MPDYAIVFARSARKELESLDPPMIERVMARIEALAQDPRPTGSRKLRGSGNLWRVRVGDYRVVYGLDDRRRMIDIVRVRPIPPHARQKFRLADGSVIERDRGDALFFYAGARGASPVIFAEPGDANLLGAVSLESLGFVLDAIRRDLLPLPMVIAASQANPAAAMAAPRSPTTATS